jgi:hypothetical protein
MPEVGPDVGRVASVSAEAGAQPIAALSQAPAVLDGFSPGGTREYEKISQEYLIALAEASRAVALRKKADSASAFHVQIAAEALSGDRSRAARRSGEIGALLIGGGFSYLGSVIYGSSYTFKNAVIVFIPLLVGCALYVYSVARG